MEMKIDIDRIETEIEISYLNLGMEKCQYLLVSSWLNNNNNNNNLLD